MNSQVQKSKKKYPWLEAITFGQVPLSGIFPNASLLLLRLYAGYTILIAGLEKLPLPDWMTDQVAGMGLPLPGTFAWLASFGEYAFGTLLLLGFLTRFSAGILAVILGVAAFGFHRLIPIGEMHIAQHYFWVFLLFAGLGGGRYSFDYHIGKLKMTFYQKLGFTILPAFVVLTMMGIFRERSGEQMNTEPTMVEISSINVAGNFNHWDPAASPMLQTDSSLYELIIENPRPGKIEFKFTVNGSWDVHLGELDQESSGFPLKGKAEIDDASNTENIQSYLPAPGNYRILFDTRDYSYRLDSVPGIHSKQ